MFFGKYGTACYNVDVFSSRISRLALARDIGRSYALKRVACVAVRRL